MDLESLRLAVYQQLATHGTAPAVDALAAAVDAGEADAVRVLRALPTPATGRSTTTAPPCCAPAPSPAATGNAEGSVLDLTTLWRLASHWYDGGLERGDTRREPAEARAYFESVGLRGEFWGLAEPG